MIFLLKFFPNSVPLIKFCFNFENVDQMGITLFLVILLPGEQFAKYLTRNAEAPKVIYSMKSGDTLPSYKMDIQIKIVFMSFAYNATTG